MGKTNREFEMKCPMCGQAVGCVHQEEDADGSMEYEYYCMNDKCPLEAFTIRERPKVTTTEASDG